MRREGILQSVGSATKVWELSIPHANNEATEVGDFPSAQRKIGLLPLADLNACLHKDATFCQHA